VYNTMSMTRAGPSATAETYLYGYHIRQWLHADTADTHTHTH